MISKAQDVKSHDYIAEYCANLGSFNYERYGGDHFVWRLKLPLPEADIDVHARAFNKLARKCTKLARLSIQFWQLYTESEGPKKWMIYAGVELEQVEHVMEVSHVETALRGRLAELWSRETFMAYEHVLEKAVCSSRQ